MKHLRFKRLIVFSNRDPWSWGGWSLSWDGHNVIGSVTALTLEVGFEYIRLRNGVEARKRSYGWSVPRIG
jgi:hypothetical protein